MELAVLRCARCGVPLPLGDETRVTCPSCGDVSDVPEQYAALHAYAASARATRRKAERIYRLLDATSLPNNAVQLWGAIGIPGLVIGIPALLWMTQDIFHWQIRTWVVFAVFFPLLFGCLVLAGLSTRVDPVSYVKVIGGRIRPGPPLPSGAPTCGACGAPLVPEPDALSATCDYCLSDSWLHDVTDAHVEGTQRERANLVDLVDAVKFQAFEMSLFIFLCMLIPGGFLLALWIGFTDVSVP